MSRWSKTIKERDDYQCLACGKYEQESDKPFHAHHIVPKGVSLDLAQTISNGVTLCQYCHISNKDYAWHKLYGDEEGNTVLFANWLHRVRKINGVKSRASRYLSDIYRGLIIIGAIGIIGWLTLGVGLFS